MGYKYANVYPMGTNIVSYESNELTDWSSIVERSYN